MGFEENDAVLTRAVEAWNAGDVEGYLRLYDPSLSLHAGAYDFPDLTAVAGMYRGFFAATSDLVLTIHESFGEGERLCARYVVTARHTGDLMGIPATGTDIAITGITVMHFEDGRVLERWDADDSAEMLAKLRETSAA
ncbi:MAG: ester cyclase, partial [Actinomycetota bacterium]